MVYTDYNYYQNTYKGKLPADTFNELNLKASREIDRNVNTRLSESIINNLSEEAQEQLKYTACALIDLIKKKEENESKKVSSISVDGVSKSFKIASLNDIKREKRDILKNLPDELTCYL